MITSCVKGFFGIKINGRGFITIWKGFFENILNIQIYDMTVGICCIILLYFLRVSWSKILHTIWNFSSQ